MFSYWRDNPLIHESFIDTLPVLPAPSELGRIMLVVPHPDDETLGCAGLMQKISTSGSPFRIIMGTDGDKHGKKERRRNEVYKAVQKCGITEDVFQFLDFPDGKLAGQEKLTHMIYKELLSFQPTTVIVTDPDDIHADHAILGRTVMELADSVESIKNVYSILIHFHRFPRPLGLLPSKPLLPPARLVKDATPWYRLELTAKELEMKKEAIKEFRSQLRTPFLRGLMLSFIRSNELYRRLRG